MKMLPVYRIRDGFENLQKNGEVFARSTEILSSGHSMCVFPEGNHGDRRTLRPLKKGLARIAFEAENQYDFNLGLKIIPTGIDYSNYENIRGRITVSFGDPVSIADLKDLYHTEPQKAMKELNNRIRTNIEPHMIDIPWDDIYYMTMDLRVIYGKRFRELKNLPDKTLFNKFDGDKEMIRMIARYREIQPDKISTMNSMVLEYWKLLRKHNLRDHIPARAPYGFINLLLNTIVLAIGFPIHIYSLINNYHLFRIPAWISRSVFKDPQFHSTGSFVITFMVMMPISYALQTLAVGLIFHTWWITLGYLFTVLPAGLYMIHYMFENRKWRSRIRYMWMLHRQSPDAARIAELRKEIFKKMDELVKNDIQIKNS